MTHQLPLCFLNSQLYLSLYFFTRRGRASRHYTAEALIININTHLFHFVLPLLFQRVNSHTDSGSQPWLCLRWCTTKPSFSNLSTSQFNQVKILAIQQSQCCRCCGDISPELILLASPPFFFEPYEGRSSFLDLASPKTW